jgi:hypothetical protein
MRGAGLAARRLSVAMMPPAGQAAAIIVPEISGNND